MLPIYYTTIKNKYDTTTKIFNLITHTKRIPFSKEINIGQNSPPQNPFAACEKLKSFFRHYSEFKIVP